MSFKYFLDMTPEENVINPSSLTKFRKLRLKDTNILDLLINKTVHIAMTEERIITAATIASGEKTDDKKLKKLVKKVVKME